MSVTSLVNDLKNFKIDPILNSDNINCDNLTLDNKNISCHNNTTSASADMIRNVNKNDTYTKKILNYRSFENSQVRSGINLFNINPKMGIGYLIAINYLETSAESVALFIKNVHFLSKDNVGELLGSVSNQFCLKVLQEFRLSFDFNNQTPDEALRNFQYYFRMPGEAQKIHAILDSFAEQYVSCNLYNDILKSNQPIDSDIILVLVYAILMLNTDLHNPSVKRKMSFEQFSKNVFGVESCKNIPIHILEIMFNNVLKNEFNVGFDHMKQLREMSNLISEKNTPKLVLPERQFIGIRDIFEIRNFKNKDRSPRSLFIFNDIVIFTRSTSHKSIKSKFSLNSNKNSFYFYVKHYKLSEIQPLTVPSEIIPFNVVLVTHSGECVSILDCQSEYNQDKVITDFKQFCFESYYTEFLKNCYYFFLFFYIILGIPKNLFKSIANDIISNQNCLQNEIVHKFKSDIDSFIYPNIDNNLSVIIGK